MRAALLIITLLLTGCATPELPPNPLDGLEVRETRWAVMLSFSDESIPLTIALQTSQAGGVPARLLVLSAFGAKLSDCYLLEGSDACQTARGAEDIAYPVMQAFRSILEADPVWLDNAKAKAICGSDWRADKDAQGNIKYQHQGAPPWALNIKRF